MKSEGEGVALVLILVGAMLAAAFGGYAGGWIAGATAVASGQYKATLVEKPDKTTYWKFEVNK